MSEHTASIEIRARFYTGTKYRHQGRSAGVKDGLDCIGLIIVVGAQVCGFSMEPSFDGSGWNRLDYGFEGYVDTIEPWLERFLVRIQDPEPGAVVVLTMPGIPDVRHFGIVTKLNSSQFGMVHGNVALGRFGECSLGAWSKRIESVWRYPV